MKDSRKRKPYDLSRRKKVGCDLDSDFLENLSRGLWKLQDRSVSLFAILESTNGLSE